MRTPESALGEIARSPDTWLRVCALHRIGELGFNGLDLLAILVPIFRGAAELLQFLRPLV